MFRLLEKKYGTQIKERTQTEAAANKHSERDKTIYRFTRKQSSYHSIPYSYIKRKGSERVIRNI